MFKRVSKNGKDIMEERYGATREELAWSAR